MWLCNEQARLIWECLAEKNVFDCDREACFKWFSKIMGDVPDLDPDIYKDFFENNVLQFDPAQLTESGMKYAVGDRAQLIFLCPTFINLN